MAGTLLNAVIGRLEAEFGRAKAAPNGYHWRIPIADALNQSVEVIATPLHDGDAVDLTVLDQLRGPATPTVSLLVREMACLDEVLPIIRRCVTGGARGDNRCRRAEP